MNTKYKTIAVPAIRYADEDEDDCLAAAAEAIAAERGIDARCDFDPRWADDERDVILIDVPA